jgi:tRNA pseudouridine38-40 synthase
MLLRNIKLTLSYDGTAYRGFQDQGPGVPTIQGTLEAAVHKLTGERLRITGAGRTDAGVHALGQVVNIRTEGSIPVERWPYALNAVLPRDIVVRDADNCETVCGDGLTKGIQEDPARRSIQHAGGFI